MVASTSRILPNTSPLIIPPRTNNSGVSYEEIACVDPDNNRIRVFYRNKIVVQGTLDMEIAGTWFSEIPLSAFSHAVT